MKRQEYLISLSETTIIESKISIIEGKYGVQFPEFVRRIISCAGETIFFDDEWRTLSFDEIMDAEMDLHVQFVKKGILPIIDCGENDFVVYDIKKRTFSLYNIIDDCVFHEKEKLEELLLK